MNLSQVTSEAVRFKMKRETKGAVLYEEVTTLDAPKPYHEQLVGNLYVKKRLFPDSNYPRNLFIDISVKADTSQKGEATNAQT